MAEEGDGDTVVQIRRKAHGFYRTFVLSGDVKTLCAMNEPRENCSNTIKALLGILEARLEEGEHTPVPDAREAPMRSRGIGPGYFLERSGKSSRIVRRK